MGDGATLAQFPVLLLGRRIRVQCQLNSDGARLECPPYRRRRSSGGHRRSCLDPTDGLDLGLQPSLNIVGLDALS
jgi:hypothetical protein